MVVTSSSNPYSADSSAAASSIVWIRADGGGEPQTLFATKDGRVVPYSLMPDGLHLAYQQLLPDGASHVWTIPINLTDPDRSHTRQAGALLALLFTNACPAVSQPRTLADFQRGVWRNCPFGRATGARFSIRTWKPHHGGGGHIHRRFICLGIAVVWPYRRSAEFNTRHVLAEFLRRLAAAGAGRETIGRNA